MKSVFPQFRLLLVEYTNQLIPTAIFTFVVSKFKCVKRVIY